MTSPRLLLLSLLLLPLVAAHAVDGQVVELTMEGAVVSVGEFTDPATARRFLVFRTSRSSNGVALAVVEATPVRVAVAPAPVVPLVEKGPPPPPPGLWDDTETWRFTDAQAAVGYTVVRTETVAGRPLYHIRRRNPAYVPPADLPLEATK